MKKLETLEQCGQIKAALESPARCKRVGYYELYSKLYYYLSTRPIQIWHLALWRNPKQLHIDLIQRILLVKQSYIVEKMQKGMKPND